MYLDLADGENLWLQSTMFPNKTIYSNFLKTQQTYHDIPPLANFFEVSFVQNEHIKLYVLPWAFFFSRTNSMALLFQQMNLEDGFCMWKTLANLTVFVKASMVSTHPLN